MYPTLAQSTLDHPTREKRLSFETCMQVEEGNNAQTIAGEGDDHQQHGKPGSESVLRLASHVGGSLLAGMKKACPPEFQVAKTSCAFRSVCQLCFCSLSTFLPLV